MGTAVRSADIDLILAALQPMQTVEQRVLAVVSRKPIQRCDLAEAAGCGVGSLSLVLPKLMKEGKIQQKILSRDVGPYRRGTKFYFTEG